MRAAAALAVVATAATAAGCGGGASAKPLAEQSIASQVQALREQLVSQQHVQREPQGSVERAFLSYWRSVQFADVQRAMNAYEDGMREAVGTTLLALALRNASEVYRTQKPRIEQVDVRGDTGVIRYFASTQTSGTGIVPLSITWARTAGMWRIRHNAALDEELKHAAQARAQYNFKPGSPDVDPRAIRAGERAAAIQAEHLERADEREAAAP